MGYGEIWYEPVMPTPEEQRMMDAAKARIANRDAERFETEDNAARFSWRGLVLAVLTVNVIVISVLWVGWLVIANG